MLGCEGGGGEGGRAKYNHDIEGGGDLKCSHGNERGCQQADGGEGAY